MPIDLRALHRRCQAEHPAQVEEAFWAVVRHYARTDLLCYGLWVHGHEHPIMVKAAFSRHGYVMAELMEKSRKTLRVAPPEHIKTLFSRWKTEQWLGQQTELAFDGGAAPPSAGYVMNTAEQAEKQCMTIAATLEGNARYRELYPRVEPHKTVGWTKNVLFLRRPYARPDPSLMATGIFGPYQGFRFGLEVVDDPTDQEDARSEATMDKQRERFAGTLLDRLVEDGECHVACTRWGKRDIPEMLLRNAEWASEEMPCYGYWEKRLEYRWLWDGGDVPRALWPEVWPEARLESKRLEKELTENSALWALAYLCSPVLAEGNLLKREWLRVYEPSIFEDAAA